MLTSVQLLLEVIISLSNLPGGRDITQDPLRRSMLYRATQAELWGGCLAGLLLLPHHNRSHSWLCPTLYAGGLLPTQVQAQVECVLQTPGRVAGFEQHRLSSAVSVDEAPF